MPAIGRFEAIVRGAPRPQGPQFLSRKGGIEGVEQVATDRGATDFPYFALTGLRFVTVLGTQSVALGCHIQPFQGSKHQPWRPSPLQSAEELPLRETTACGVRMLRDQATHGREHRSTRADSPKLETILKAVADSVHRQPVPIRSYVFNRAVANRWTSGHGV